jgi:hypothetical protein
MSATASTPHEALPSYDITPEPLSTPTALCADLVDEVLPEADGSAAEAFDAYRSRLDAADAALRKVARTGDVDAFAAAFADFLNELRSSPEKSKLSTEGIVCPAR